ncbi:MAG: acetate--CoA ligase family protein [Rhodospirillales bacterium]
MVDIARLRRYLNPRHVAVIGGHWSDEVIRQLEKIGYQGEIWPVNPKRDELAGHKCYPRLEDLPEAPDAAFIGVNRDATIEAVKLLAEMGAGGALCFASGYAEVGNEGRERQQRLVEAAGDMPIQGPNCYGLINYLDGVTLWPDQHGGKRVDRGVAVLSQSGNVAVNVTMQRRGLPLAYLISLGNQAQTGVAEFIDAMLDDERITAIGILIEGLPDIPRFSAAAARALERGIPIVAMKSGRSEAGARITVSHTSTLAGADNLYDAMFERYGIVRVDTLPVMMETLKFLSIAGPLDGNRIVSLSCSGGEASMIADLAEGRDLAFDDFDSASRERIRATTHELVHVANPFDYHTFDWGKGENLKRTFTEVARSGFDVRMIMLDWPPRDVCDPRDWNATLDAFIAACDAAPGASVVVSSLHESLPPEARDAMIARGIVPMYGLGETLTAMEAAVWIGRRQRAAAAGRPSAMTPVAALDVGAVRIVDEAESKRRLAAYGLTVPAGRVTDAAGAPDAAAEIGYPVVVKAVGAHLIHKSDVGGVALGLVDGAAVAAAAEGMKGLSDRFLIERMAPGALAELIIGVTRDPQFGPVLVIGAGGILVELMKDSQALLFPVARADVEAAIARLKVSRLLDGYRGKPAADRAALVDAIMAVAAFAEAHADSLVELDVNPLLVFEDGVMAVDALIRSL